MWQQMHKQKKNAKRCIIEEKENKKKKIKNKAIETSKLNQNKNQNRSRSNIFKETKPYMSTKKPAETVVSGALSNQFPDIISPCNEGEISYRPNTSVLHKDSGICLIVNQI